jgi:hypothetical protein
MLNGAWAVSAGAAWMAKTKQHCITSCAERIATSIFRIDGLRGATAPGLTSAH